MGEYIDVTMRRTLDLAKKGDAHAFEELITPLEGDVWRVCHWYMHNSEDARDCAQEAMVKAWRSIGQFRGDASLKTWLRKIAVSCCLDAKRAAQRRGDGQTSSFEVLEEEGMPFLHADPSPEAQTIARAEREAVREALLSLPEAFRTPLEMHVFDGLGYDAIAQALHVPLGTVKSRIARARIDLAKKMRDWREQSPAPGVYGSERRTHK